VSVPAQPVKPPTVEDLTEALSVVWRMLDHAASTRPWLLIGVGLFVLLAIFLWRWAPRFRKTS
jgi:hypothetical protein